MLITEVRHPDWTNQVENWLKWRLTYQGGRPFVNKYLKRFSNRETHEEFNQRRRVTYCPSFAKAAINDIKNAIYQRTVNIIREGGSKSYNQAVEGRNGGVDLCGSSMNFFIGQTILPELLTMRRVGIYVDAPPLQGPTRADIINFHPYFYYYPTEDILSWHIDPSISPTPLNLLLRDCYPEIDPATNLPTSQGTKYRHLYIKDGIVNVDTYDHRGDILNQTIQLSIPIIPFAMPELSHSLLEDASDYQIALLNIESSDINYILSANFPFYTEQYDIRSDSPFVTGQESDELTVGVTKGRRYAKSVERPGYIHPSSEPLKASMEKSRQLKEDIKELINLSVANLKTESPTLVNQGLESGLSYIGLILENTERRLADIWAAYESSVPATIIYPAEYSLPDSKSRLEEINNKLELVDTITSPRLKRELVKQIARLAVGNQLSTPILQSIYDEIDALPVATGSYKAIAQDIISGVVSLETASLARGYSDPESEIQQAAIDHENRLARIQMAQTSPDSQVINPRTDPTQNGVPEKAQRGDGK